MQRVAIEGLHAEQAAIQLLRTRLVAARKLAQFAVVQEGMSRALIDGKRALVELFGSVRVVVQLLQQAPQGR